MTPQETWTVTLTGTTAATLKNGERINLTATVRSTNLARPAGKVAGVDVVTGLPKTGGPVDQLFVIISSISGLALLRRWKRA